MKRTEIEIKLDKVRHLKFGHNAFCAMEEALGSMTVAVLDSHRGQRAMLFAGLLHEDERLTLEQAGQFFDDHDAGYIMGKIREAVSGTEPDLADRDRTAKIQDVIVDDLRNNGPIRQALTDKEPQPTV